MNQASSQHFPVIVCSEFVVRFTAPARLDDYPGAAWRSGLGAMLRPLWCDYPHTVDEEGHDPRPECECAFISDWKTTRAWNPVALAGAGRGEGSAPVPRPYIVNPLHAGRAGFEPGDATRVRLTLVGAATQRWDDWRRAFLLLGERGLGQGYKTGKGRFSVEAILDGDGFTPLTVRSGSELLCLPGRLKEARVEQRVRALLEQGGDRRLTMVFLRPLSLRDGRKGDATAFRPLWDALTGRIESLALHNAGQVLAGDFKGLAKLAQQVRVADEQLLDVQQARVSRRGHCGAFPAVPATGLAGHLTFEAPSGLLAEFLPLLVLGEWLHVGRHCNTGLGAYRLVAG